MAGADLFYKAKPKRYQSQFIPLPLQAIQGALAGRQKRYDTTKAYLDQYADFEIKSLKGDDRTYADAKEKLVRDFVDESVDKDLGDPQYLREFTNILRDLKRDDYLKTINKHYLIDQQEQAWVAKQKEDGEYAYNSILEQDYLRKKKEYETPGSGGGQKLSLGDPQITRGVDERKIMQEVYNQIKGNVVERTVTDPGSGETYIEKTENIDPVRIAEATSDAFEQFNSPSHPAGNQIKTRFRELNKSLESRGLSPISWTEQDAALAEAFDAKVGDPMTEGQFLFKEMFNTGMEKSYGKVTSKGLTKALKAANEQLEISSQQQPVFDMQAQRGYEKDPEFKVTQASEIFKKYPVLEEELTTGMNEIMKGKSAYQEAYNKAKSELVAAGDTNPDPMKIHNLITSNEAYGLTQEQRAVFEADTPLNMLDPDYEPYQYKQLEHTLKDAKDDYLDAENQLQMALSENFPGGKEEYFKQQKIFEDDEQYAAAAVQSLDMRETIENSVEKATKGEMLGNFMLNLDYLIEGKDLPTGRGDLYVGIESNGQMTIGTKGELSRGNYGKGVWQIDSTEYGDDHIGKYLVDNGLAEPDVGYRGEAGVASQKDIHNFLITTPFTMNLQHGGYKTKNGQVIPKTNKKIQANSVVEMIATLPGWNTEIQEAMPLVGKDPNNVNDVAEFLSYDNIEAVKRNQYKTKEGKNVYIAADQMRIAWRAWQDNTNGTLNYAQTLKREKEFVEGDPTALTTAEKVTYNKPNTVFGRLRNYDDDAKGYYKSESKGGKIVTAKKMTPSPNKIINQLKKNPSYWTIYGEDGKILTAEEKSKIDIENANFTAEHVDKNYDEATFDGTAIQKVRVTDPNNKDRTVEVDQTRQLTFVLTGVVDLADYNEARGDELYSNYLKDVNSEAGKKDYLNYLNFDNPAFAKKLQLMEEKDQPLDYTANGVTFTARRSVNGGYDLEATYIDELGNEEVMETDHPRTLGQLATKIRTIEKYQEAKERFDGKEITEEEWKEWLRGWATGVYE